MVMEILKSFVVVFHSRFMYITSNFSCEFADCQLAQDAACLSHLAPRKPVHRLQMLWNLKRGSGRRRHNWLFVYMYKAWCIAMANYDLSLNLLERMKHSETDPAVFCIPRARAVWALFASSLGRKFRCRVHSFSSLPEFLFSVGCTAFCVASSWPCRIITVSRWPFGQRLHEGQRATSIAGRCGGSIFVRHVVSIASLALYSEIFSLSWGQKGTYRLIWP